MNSRLKDIINNAEVVSFDVFDTMIFRTVGNPEYVFQRVADLVKIDNFVNLRKQAQILAFKNMKAERNEITLNDIYANINLTSEQQINCKNKEIQTELEVCYLNDEIRSVFEYAQKCKKRIIAVSDMYLDSEIITEILMNSGYSGITKIYSSASCNATKRENGELYHYVLKKENINSSQMVHIGDNKLSDIDNAQRLGITTFYYTPNSTFKNCNYLHEFQSKIHLDRNISAVQIGQKVISPLVSSFLEWMHKDGKREGVSKILFLSRDGFIPFKTYKKSFIDPIDSSYFFGSRVSFAHALISPVNFDEMLTFLISGCEGLTISDVFQRINLPLPNKRELLRAGFASFFKRISDKKDVEKLRQLFIEMKMIICKKSAYTRNNLIKYINQVIKNDQKIGIVDIGWSGSTQTYLCKFLELYLPKVTVTGYYFGLIKSPRYFSNKNADLVMKGFITDIQKNEHIMPILYKHRAILELLLTAPHNTVIDYYEENEEVKPFFARETSSDNRIKDINRDVYKGINCLLEKDKNDSFRVENLISFLQLIEMNSLPIFNGIYNFDSWSHSSKKQQRLQDYA